MKLVRPSVACAALLLATGCERAGKLADDLLPRTHTRAASPDGRFEATVYQGLNPDPPDDHLYLAVPGRRAQRLMSLAPDADWCRTIVWSPDSRMVGFLINEQRLAVFDTGTATLAAMLVLANTNGYPGDEEARQVSLGNDGVVVFDRYVRPTMLLNGDKGVIEAPVTIFGTYGRPIHRPERFVRQERMRIPQPQMRSGTGQTGASPGEPATAAEH